MKKYRSLLVIAGILFFIIAWSILLFYVSPQEIVENIGANNTLIIAFLVSTLGGLSSITSTSYYAMLTTFSAGGANPILLGISAGIGLTISDSLIYYLGTKGHDILSGKLLEYANKIAYWVNKKHDRLVQFLAFVYTGLTPLPNDLLTGSLGLAEYNFRKFLPALLLGNITLSIIIAEFASRIELVQKIFG